MHTKRRIKLIKPPLQLKLTLIFVGISALSLLLQAVLLMSGLTRASLDLPNDHLVMLDQINSIVFGALMSSFVLFLPLTFAVGILTTFRLAGPIYRLEMFLNQVIRGEKPADVRLRGGDELKDFCALINQATAPLRVADSALETETDPESLPSILGAKPSDPGAQTADTTEMLEADLDR